MGIGDSQVQHPAAEDFSTLCNKDAALEARQSALDRLRPVFQSLRAKLSAEGGQAITAEEAAVCDAIRQLSEQGVSSHLRRRGFPAARARQMGEDLQVEVLEHVVLKLAGGCYQARAEYGIGPWIAFVAFRKVVDLHRREEKARRRGDPRQPQQEEAVDHRLADMGTSWPVIQRILLRSPPRGPAGVTIDYGAVNAWLARYVALRYRMQRRQTEPIGERLGLAEQVIQWCQEVGGRQICAILRPLLDAWGMFRQRLEQAEIGLRQLTGAMLQALPANGQPPPTVVQWYQWRTRSKDWWMNQRITGDEESKASDLFLKHVHGED